MDNVATVGQHLGLTGMRERAAMVGADLQIESAPAGARRLSCAPLCLRRRSRVPEMASPLRVLLADDHATVRQGLKLLIDSQPDMAVVGEATDGHRVLEEAGVLKPDIVVMDISMPGMNGLIATRTLKQLQPDVAIVALTRHDDDTFLEELLRAGASGTS